MPIQHQAQLDAICEQRREENYQAYIREVGEETLVLFPDLSVK